MFRSFLVADQIYDHLDNYQLSLMANGIYRARTVSASNYLYPMYAYRDGNIFYTSTSVYQLIQHKERFVRNPRFQTTHRYRPSFLTVDAEIFRVRTSYRRSSLELTDPETISAIGADLIQDYVSEIERRFPDAVHILLMGGKDSENIILAQRNSPWIVLSGEPNAPLNMKFLDDNAINVEHFIGCPDETDDGLLLEEILGSDCFYDVADMRYVVLLDKLVSEYAGQAVIWMGTSGDGIFARNTNHSDQDYYAVHDLLVGMMVGIYHQVLKNILDVPVVSPYQSPRMLDELFYKFDPYFVDTSGDVRAQIGRILLGRPVKYPDKNPQPGPMNRRRRRSLPIYLEELKQTGVTFRGREFISLLIQGKERLTYFIDQNSSRPRTPISRFLFCFRFFVARWIPAFRVKRYEISAREIV